MKKKMISVLLGAAMAASMATSAFAADTVNIMSFTDEVPNMLKAYVEAHPDCGFEIGDPVIIATTDGAYQPALDEKLVNGGEDAPDIYCAEAAFILKYSQGDMAEYAASYEDLGIDVEAALEAAEIAPYTVDIGTRPSDEKLVALGYQSTGGAFIYRRSIAQDAFGTDDPAEIGEIIGAGSGNWEKFWEAAETLKGKGYGIVSGDGDIWHAVENSSDQGWVVDGKLTIDPKREEFMDIAKTLKDNDYHNDTQDWQDAWFADMAGVGPKQIFGFFGPAWLINYTIGPNCGETAGDWAVCASPVGFFWGGTWVLVNKDSVDKPGVKELVEWITLDPTEDGLQYAWANGLMNDAGTKDSVASSAVLAISDGSMEFLGGQNMFDAFIPANEYANGKNLTQYDETINQYWRDAVRQYTSGDKDKETAIADFKQNVADNLDIIVE